MIYRKLNNTKENNFLQKSTHSSRHLPSPILSLVYPVNHLYILIKGLCCRLGKSVHKPELNNTLYNFSNMQCMQNAN